MFFENRLHLRREITEAIAGCNTETGRFIW
jgi:hypothetical protein